MGERRRENVSPGNKKTAAIHPGGIAAAEDLRQSLGLRCD